MECSIHPYREYIPENASKLIIGTIPPFRFCVSGEKRLYPRDVDFYYGSRDNGFWLTSASGCSKSLMRE